VNDNPNAVSFGKDVDSVDALFIDQYIHGLIDAFPVCSAVCGNKNLEIGEQCDDGNRINGDGCDSLCRVEFCGDRIIQKSLGEQCDDGNNKNGDGCDFKCKIEIKTTTTTLKPTTTITIPPPCKNECPAWGVKECVNNGFRVCGNFDSDICFEWSDIAFCPALTACSLGKCILISTTTTMITSSTTTASTTSTTTTVSPTSTTSTTTSTTSTLQTPTTLPSCTDECTANERFCTNEFAYKQCGNFDGDSCLEFGFFGCGKGEMCSNGICVQATYTGCVHECPSWNVRQCSGNGYQICGNWDSDSCFEWSNITMCSNTCSKGRCV
jgi:cysteine-rich repeat protein